MTKIWKMDSNLLVNNETECLKECLMSRTAIVAPKICACTLVSMMVVLIVGDVLQECVCGDTMPQTLWVIEKNIKLKKKGVTD